MILQSKTDRDSNWKDNTNLFSTNFLIFPLWEIQVLLLLDLEKRPARFSHWVISRVAALFLTSNCPIKAEMWPIKVWDCLVMPVRIVHPQNYLTTPKLSINCHLTVRMPFLITHFLGKKRVFRDPIFCTAAWNNCSGHDNYSPISSISLAPLNLFGHGLSRQISQNKYVWMCWIKEFKPIFIIMLILNHACVQINH